MFGSKCYGFILMYCSTVCSLAWGMMQNLTHTIECQSDMLNQCPPNSLCDDGSCVCMKQFTHNPNYIRQKTGEYCLLIEETTTPSSALNKTLSVGHIFKEHPEPHHIIGGIFIPISAALILLLAIVMVKKMHIIQRIRQRLHSNRARRPAYEDVVLVGYEQ
ncbi:uncharacterized protein LOC129747246 [Uranotaenia lowii]|uniref:uncharacterized protein LOC129747246 n=1 Tax=Uranotaenia lowii TaxID=190385 RepID=UPI0024783D55|nr:uncharacterized protein LOC129747246 [Uranotaenia lowii]